ncbi:MAG: sigma-70 family RNA polymerase sigma factor [bacterium]|nr:sigma-70 family RNA polymerase sigma factor [bacterium]
MNELNDYELLDSIKEEDESSFLLLYNKYYPLLKSKSKQVFQRIKSPAISFEDIEQEMIIAFYTIVRKYNSFGVANFPTYLTCCLNNKVINYLKLKITRNSQVETVSLELLIERNAMDCLDKLPLYRTYDDIIEESNNIEDFIDNNFSFQNIIIAKLRIQNYTPKEIAEIIDESSKKVSNQLAYMKKSLSKNLNFQC